MNIEMRKKWFEGMADRVKATGMQLQQTLELGTVMDTLAPVEEASSEELACYAQLPGDRQSYYALDVGCGLSSRLGRKAFGKPVNVVGVDAMSQPIMELLSRAKLPMPHPIVNVLAEDLALIWPPGSFDLVVCRDALDCFWDPCAALESMARALRPGGTLLVDTYSRAPDTLRLWGIRSRDGTLSYEAHAHPSIEGFVSQVAGLALEVTSESTAQGDHIRVRARRPAEGLVLAKALPKAR